MSYFNELLPEIYSDEHQNWSLQSKALCDVKLRDLEFSSEGVSMASCQILMFRHETGSCYNSGMLCPICTNLHMFDKTPDMKRST